MTFRLLMLVGAMLLPACAPSLASRCSDAGEKILDEARKAPPAEREKHAARLSTLHDRCDTALAAMEAVESVLEATE